jgi:hypothetical protein
MSKENSVSIEELLAINRFQSEFQSELEGIDISVSISNGAIVLLAKNIEELGFINLTFNNPDYRFEGNYAIRCIYK